MKMTKNFTPENNALCFCHQGFIGLRSRVWIVMRPTENDLTRLYKNGDISVVISYS